MPHDSPCLEKQIVYFKQKQQSRFTSILLSGRLFVERVLESVPADFPNIAQKSSTVATAVVKLIAIVVIQWWRGLADVVATLMATFVISESWHWWIHRRLLAPTPFLEEELFSSLYPSLKSSALSLQWVLLRIRTQYYIAGLRDSAKFLHRQTYPYPFLASPFCSQCICEWRVDSGRQLSMHASVSVFIYKRDLQTNLAFFIRSSILLI